MKASEFILFSLCLVAMTDITVSFTRLRSWQQDPARGYGTRYFEENHSNPHRNKKWSMYVDGRLKGYFDMDDGGCDRVVLHNYHEPGYPVKNFEVELILDSRQFYTHGRRPNESHGYGKWLVDRNHGGGGLPQPFDITRHKRAQRNRNWGATCWLTDSIGGGHGGLEPPQPFDTGRKRG